MNQHREDKDDNATDREELGISTGLMEWFESAPWVIEGRLVSKDDRKNQSLNPLSGYQVELPSRRWLMEEISRPEESGAIDDQTPERL
ncbi:MAG: hypothetical protein NTV86_18920 [Planctomycetota bacterium]|nr:hypothetical protein [Planctomycetota bacterium]